MDHRFEYINPGKPRQEHKEGSWNQELRLSPQRIQLESRLMWAYLSYIGRPKPLGTALPTEDLTLLHQG